MQGLGLAYAGGLGEPCSRSAYWLAVAPCFLAWVLVRMEKTILLTARHHVSHNKRGPEEQKEKTFHKYGSCSLFAFLVPLLPARGLRLPLVIVQ